MGTSSGHPWCAALVIINGHKMAGASVTADDATGSGMGYLGLAGDHLDAPCRPRGKENRYALKPDIACMPISPPDGLTVDAESMERNA